MAATVAVAMALVATGTVALIGSTRHAGAVRPAPARPAAAPDEPVVASGSLTQTIASLQSRLTAVPADWSSWATLGLAYVQQGRVTADPTYYPKAEAVLNRSLRIHAHGNLPALTASQRWPWPGTTSPEPWISDGEPWPWTTSTRTPTA
jgi:hypothetical protein